MQVQYHETFSDRGKLDKIMKGNGWQLKTTSVNKVSKLLQTLSIETRRILVNKAQIDRMKLMSRKHKPHSEVLILQTNAWEFLQLPIPQ